MAPSDKLSQFILEILYKTIDGLSHSLKAWIIISHDNRSKVCCSVNIDAHISQVILLFRQRICIPLVEHPVSRCLSVILRSTDIVQHSSLILEEFFNHNKNCLLNIPVQNGFELVFGRNEELIYSFVRYHQVLNETYFILLPLCSNEIKRIHARRFQHVR